MGYLDSEDEDEIRNPSPVAFNLDASLLQSNLYSPLCTVESMDHQYGEKKGWLGVFSRRKKDRADSGRRGTFGFITRTYRTRSVAILDTFGICELTVILQNFILLIPKPF